MEFKIYIILFFLFLFIRSNTFIGMLAKIKGTVGPGGDLSNYGIVLQGISLVIIYIILEMLVNNDII